MAIVFYVLLWFLMGIFTTMLAVRYMGKLDDVEIYLLSTAFWPITLIGTIVYVFQVNTDILSLKEFFEILEKKDKK